MFHRNKIMKIVFWWGMPCKAISGVWRELADMDNINVEVVCEGEITTSRRRLGWESPDVGNAALSIMPHNHETEYIHHIIEESKDAIHIFNGIYSRKYINYAIKYAISRDVIFGVMIEAPFNPYRGVMRAVKHMYIKMAIPLRVRQVIGKCRFLLSLSGNCIELFLDQGWSRDQFYPFGYFSDEQRTEMIQHSQVRQSIRLLCTGYIVKNKGHEILLRALSELKKVHGQSIECIITGYGPEDNRLREISKRLELDGIVKFVGVLSDEELMQIKRETDLFVAPGFEEPWGIRINEAIQHGIPVVISSGIRARELVTAGKVGKIFRRGDYRSLAEAIRYFVEDRGRLTEYRERAATYSQRIHPRQAVLYLREVLEYVIGNSQTKPLLPIWLRNS